MVYQEEMKRLARDTAKIRAIREEMERELRKLQAEEVAAGE